METARQKDHDKKTRVVAYKGFHVFKKKYIYIFMLIYINSILKKYNFSIYESDGMDFRTMVPP